MNGTLAANLFLKGVYAVSRSFRFHRKRGAFCHSGWCQQCRVIGPDGSAVLACQISAHGVREPKWDPLRAVGVIAEASRPWFYERQVFGGVVQDGFLGAIRRLSAAPSLAPTANLPTRPPSESIRCDVLVVGGGPAGRLAAQVLSDAGRTGLLFSASHMPEFSVAGFHYLPNHVCVGFYDAGRRALCIGPDRNRLIEFSSVVLATGAYDRLPTVVGNDLPGVIGLRGFERLARMKSVGAGTRLGIYAGRAEAERALAATAAAGIKPLFVAGPGSLPDCSGVRMEQTTLQALIGRGKLSGVKWGDGNSSACDVLVCGFTQPSYELTAQLGIELVLAGDPPVLMPKMTSTHSLLLVGESAGAVALASSHSQSLSAVQEWLAGERSTNATQAAPVSPRAPDDDAFVCLCEDVRVGDIRAAVAEGYADVELVKRHTGAATGPCQGKLCHAALASLLNPDRPRIPTPRPLARPIPLRMLAAVAAKKVNGVEDGSEA